MQVNGKTFVVTGAAGGIGQQVVLQLLELGARVAAVDVSAERLAATEQVAHAGERLSCHAVDITDMDAVSTLPAQVIAAHGQVDGLLNVAGIIQPFVKFADLDRSVIEKLMAVNFWGQVNMVQAFLPELQKRPQAAILNVSSMGGFLPVPGQTMYGASKAAVKLFTEGLAAEMRGTSVQVTVVFPGGVATNITANSGIATPAMTPEMEASAAKTTTPEDAARAIVRGLVRGSYRVVIGRDAQMMDVLSRLHPRRAMNLIAQQMASLLTM